MEAMADLVVSRTRDGVSYQIVIRRPGPMMGGSLFQILPKGEATGSWEVAIFYKLPAILKLSSFQPRFCVVKFSFYGSFEWKLVLRASAAPAIVKIGGDCIKE